MNVAGGRVVSEPPGPARGSCGTRGWRCCGSCRSAQVYRPRGYARVWVLSNLACAIADGARLVSDFR